MNHIPTNVCLDNPEGRETHQTRMAMRPAKEKAYVLAFGREEGYSWQQHCDENQGDTSYMMRRPPRFLPSSPKSVVLASFSSEVGPLFDGRGERESEPRKEFLTPSHSLSHYGHTPSSFFFAPQTAVLNRGQVYSLSKNNHRPKDRMSQRK